MNDRSMSRTRRVVRALDYIEANFGPGFDVLQAAEQAAMSPWHFQHVFHEIVGVPVKDYVRRRRLNLASLDLLRTGRPIIDIAFDAGFASPEAFTRAFLARFGVAPSRSRRLPLGTFPSTTTLDHGQSRDTCRAPRHYRWRGSPALLDTRWRSESSHGTEATS